MNILVQLQLNDQLSIGYSYDNVINRLHAITRGSHEFMMSYNFNFFGLKVVSPRYF
jgi:hypothetical protein